MWMYNFLVVTAVIAAVTASLDLNEPLERDEIIEAVNSAETTWKAGRNFSPSLKKNYIKHLLGLKRRQGPSRLPKYVPQGEDFEVPKSFDARDNWPNCLSIQHIRDQGPCGSCWGVAAAGAFTDRLCIASNASITVSLSAQQLISCCTECGDGCDGGYEDMAWQYFQQTGIVTGGDYKSKEGCQPYTLPACEHHVNGSRKSCDSYGHLPTPTCKMNCYNKKYKTPFKQDLHKVKSTFTLSNVKQIMQEVYKNGPVEAGFDVYEDFLSYKSGVYQHTTGDQIGGHAVKIIGWGVENKTPYWLVANQWNSDWGEEGLFKIKKGTNECDFESDISGGMPDV